MFYNDVYENVHIFYNDNPFYLLHVLVKLKVEINNMYQYSEALYLRQNYLTELWGCVSLADEIYRVYSILLIRKSKLFYSITSDIYVEVYYCHIHIMNIHARQSSINSQIGTWDMGSIFVG